MSDAAVELTEDEIVWTPVAEEDDGDYISLPNSPELVGFSLAFEEPPVKRARTAKVTLVWEEYLEFLKEVPGKTSRLFVFNDSNAEEPERAARARARSIRARLVKTQPHEDFTILVEKFREDESWRVYARYNGGASADLIMERAKIVTERHERGVRIAAARHGSK